jgi:hypothetical protein
MAFFIGGLVNADLASLIILNAQKQLTLLGELHIQAQTETLNIESQNWEQLTRTMATKEDLVNQITLLEIELKDQLKKGSLNKDAISLESREIIPRIDTERIQLREKIIQVERRNLTLLEGAKAEAIRGSQQIRQYEKVMQTYLSSQSQVSKISQIAD